MDKEQAKAMAAIYRKLRHAMTFVGVELFRRKLELGNDALKNLPISEFQAHALADLGNFYLYAQNVVSPDMAIDEVLDLMDETGWFTDKGLGMLTLQDLAPFIQPPAKGKK
jgi:hypothetical protein